MSAPLVVVVTPAQRRVLLDFMRDGASSETVAGRLGMNRFNVNHHLGCVRRAAGQPTYTALALALERGQVKLRSSRTRTGDVA